MYKKLEIDPATYLFASTFHDFSRLMLAPARFEEKVVASREKSMQKKSMCKADGYFFIGSE